MAAILIFCHFQKMYFACNGTNCYNGINRGNVSSTCGITSTPSLEFLRLKLVAARNYFPLAQKSCTQMVDFDRLLVMGINLLLPVL